MTKSITVVLLLLLAVLQYEFWFSDGGVFSVVRLKQHITEQVAWNEKLKERNITLMADIQDLKNGHQAIEDRARSELGMVKPGEIFYQVIQH